MTDEERKKKREKHDAAVDSAKALTAGMCCGAILSFESEPELFKSLAAFPTLLYHILASGIIITALIMAVGGLYNRCCPYPGDTQKAVPGWRMFVYGLACFAFVFIVLGMWATRIS